MLCESKHVTSWTRQNPGDGKQMGAPGAGEGGGVTRQSTEEPGQGGCPVGRRTGGHEAPYICPEPWNADLRPAGFHASVATWDQWLHPGGVSCPPAQLWVRWTYRADKLWEELWSGTRSEQGLQAEKTAHFWHRVLFPVPPQPPVPDRTW